MNAMPVCFSEQGLGAAVTHATWYAYSTPLASPCCWDILFSYLKSQCKLCRRSRAAECSGPSLGLYMAYSFLNYDREPLFANIKGCYDFLNANLTVCGFVDATISFEMGISDGYIIFMNIFSSQVLVATAAQYTWYAHLLLSLIIFAITIILPCSST